MSRKPVSPKRVSQHRVARKGPGLPAEMIRRCASSPVVSAIRAEVSSAVPAGNCLPCHGYNGASRPRILYVLEMPGPRLDDDGSTVTLDLHGLTVDEAIDVTYDTLRLAQDRGRASLKIIHGSSTSAPGRRTIKSALYERLESGMLVGGHVHVMKKRSSITLSLDITASTDPTRIRLLDVW